MYARARYKLDIDDKVIQAGRFDNKSTQEEQEEFLVNVLRSWVEIIFICDYSVRSSKQTKRRITKSPET